MNAYTTAAADMFEGFRTASIISTGTQSDIQRIVISALTVGTGLLLLTENRFIDIFVCID